MKELADDILANFISLSRGNPSNKNPGKGKIVEQDLEILDSFFELAKSQNWVKAADILNLQAEYSNLKEGLVKDDEKIAAEIESRSLPVLAPKEDKLAIFERQQKILEILREKDKAQVWEIKQIFSDISKRTLRRDFKSLLKQGLIERIGERNATFYQLKR